MRLHQSYVRNSILFLFFALLSSSFCSSDVFAATLQLTWSDNSTNEDGFKIERKTGTAGTYAQLASIGPNITSYTDSAVVDGTTYCYRVNAFNTAGNSPYTAEVCGTPPAVTQTFSLTVVKAGTGSGTVSSSPAGINCGATCSGSYNSGTPITLTANPAAGSVFAGWSGTGCTTGSVTLGGNTTCTATFNPQPVQTFTLTLNKGGAGSGTVTSSPAGINCGTACSSTSSSFTSSTVVALTATAATGSTFASWSPAGCGNSTMTANITCTATFNLTPPATFILTVTKTGSGTGTVKNANLTINCGTDCSEAYPSGSPIALTATADAGSTFAGWNTQTCASYTITSNMSCIATFNTLATQPPPNPSATRIGIFRPSTGEWFLDVDGDGAFDGCAVDKCLTNYGKNMLPVVGDWHGQGNSQIGAFDPATGAWHLDNGNGQWDACGPAGDFCVTSFGQQGMLPVVRELTNSDIVVIGTFQAQSITRTSSGKKITKHGLWKFDTDGDGVLDTCGIDECIENFGASGDLPVVGDWNGAGAEEIGIFRPRYGQWYLDFNANARRDGSRVDKILGPFGISGDLPVVGDWDGTAVIRIGVFRPSTGKWYLDLNGNGKLDSCTVDACLGPFGHAGDLPVVGRW